MTPKLSILFQVDLEANQVTVAVTGQLTKTNQQALYPLIERIRALVPGIRITVDLSAVRAADTAGLDLLSRAIDGADGSDAGRIRLVLPEPPPLRSSVRQPGTPSRTLAGWRSATVPLATPASARRTAA